MGLTEIYIKLLAFGKKWILHLGAFIILLIYLAPHFINPDQSVFLIHDNLDSNVVWNTVLAKSPNVFSIANLEIEGILNTLPSGVYRSEFTYITLLYHFFTPLVAYNINAVFVHLFGFISALLFLNYTFRRTPLTVRIGLSLCFALLPFRTAALLSISGQPLIALAALHLFHKNKLEMALSVMFLFPFFSDLFLVNTFTLAALIVFGILQFFRARKFPLHLFAGIVVFILGSITVHFKLFELIFIDGFESHRNLTRNILNAKLNLKGLVGTSIMTAIKGQYHFHTFPYLLSVPIWLIGLLLTFNQRKKFTLILLSCFILCLIGFANQIWGWQPFANIISAISGIDAFNFRFYTLIPFFAFLTFAFCFDSCNRTRTRNIYAHVSISTLILLSFFPIFTDDVNGSLYLESPFYNNYIQVNNPEHQSFSDYYQVSAFQGIRLNRMIDFDELKVACFGFAPAIAQMNRINTVDGYFGIYSTSYYKNWSTMLNEEDNNNFSSWGNQCYLFSNELVQHPYKRQIDHLNIKPELLKKTGANGILSRLKISQIGDLVIKPIQIKTETKNFEVMYFYPL